MRGQVDIPKTFEQVSLKYIWFYLKDFAIDFEMNTSLIQTRAILSINSDEESKKKIFSAHQKMISPDTKSVMEDLIQKYQREFGEHTEITIKRA